MSNHGAADHSGFAVGAGVAYTATQMTGVMALVVVSTVSFVAVLGLLFIIAISGYITRNSVDEHLFVRTHLSTYFVCLLLCDGLQAIGAIMSLRWIVDKEVVFGPICVVQGIVKQAANVGIATWNVVIALHGFCLLVLEGKEHLFLHVFTLISGWGFICAVAVYGPVVTLSRRGGSFYNVADYWCDISPEFPHAQFILGFVVMIIALSVCSVLCLLVFLRFRGWVVVKGWRVRINFTGWRAQDFWRDDFPKTKLHSFAKRMFVHPVAYTVLVTPITTVQLLKWLGDNVRREGAISCTAVFLLAGTVNVILFFATRILTLDSMTRRHADNSASEIALSDIFDASAYNPDPAPIRSSAEETNSHEKAKPILRRNESRSSSRTLDSEHQVESAEVSDVETIRISVLTVFDADVASLQDVELSARTVDTPKRGIDMFEQH